MHSVMRSALAKRWLAGVVCLTLFAAAAGCEPKDRRPGTWLSGAEATAPVADWSFSNDYQEVLIETRPWYGIPHSVTTVLATSNGKVFVPSIYSEPVEFPEGKYWNRIVARNPLVRIKIGGTLYTMEARPAADPAEFEEGFAALAAKYDFWRKVYDDPDSDMPFVIIRMHPRLAGVAAP
jgi:hypothetical protein